jgi:LmbE family N-acetylglucosaminyl deacetylase
MQSDIVMARRNLLKAMVALGADATLAGCSKGSWLDRLTDVGLPNSLGEGRTDIRPWARYPEKTDLMMLADRPPLLETPLHYFLQDLPIVVLDLDSHFCDRSSYAGQKNGAAIVDNIHYEDFAQRLDAEAPDAVFTHWMVGNHRDHRAISMLSYDAWQKSGRKFALYYYEVSDGEDTMQFSPNRYVDITKMEPRKKAACYAHASQTPDRYYELQDPGGTFQGPGKRLHASRSLCLATAKSHGYPHLIR